MLVVDARSLYDFTTRETGKLPSDRRLAIDLRLLQEHFERSKWVMRWVMGPQQLGDTLTKKLRPPEYLHKVMETGRYQAVRDRTLEAKVRSAGAAMKQQAEEQLQAENKEKDRKLTDPTERKKARERSQRKQKNHRRRLQQLLGDEKPGENWKGYIEGAAVTMALAAGIAWYTNIPQ